MHIDLNIDLLPPNLQKDVIRISSVAIHKRLNIDEIVPYLNEQGLISAEEMDVLCSPYLLREYKINKLINGLPLKGSDFLRQFLHCLLQTTNGTGHKELANSIILHAYIEKKLSAIKSNKYTFVHLF